MRTIVIGCDNAAVEMKNMVIAHLEAKGHRTENMGVDSTEDPANYPGLAKKVCAEVVRSGFQKRGVLFCGTGIGMAISANKCKGIRAAVCHDIFSARRSVLSNSCNVLCLGARVIGPETAKAILDEWIQLEFVDGSSTPKVQDILAMEEEAFR